MLRHAIAALCLLTAFSASAQEGDAIAPLDSDFKRITPVENKSADMLTTKRDPSARAAEQAHAAPTPENTPAPPAPAPSSGIVPFGVSAPAPAPARYSPDKVPFGRAAPAAPTIPTGPHTSIATPVDDVDSIDATEPAPPTPVAPEENPAAQDPAEPTAFSSPIFSEKDDIKGPRKMVFRVLNKVTAQSEIFKAAPGDVVKFGKLEITAVSCRVSAPNSLNDYAGLFNINENLPGTGAELTKKQLFRGWMYASSPSIAALEHPIYDVTMVSCDPIATTPKAEEKTAKKPEKKAKK